MKEYYIMLDDGSQAGPYEETDLRAMIQQRDLPEDVYCWAEGLSEWMPANQIFTPAAAVHRPKSRRAAAPAKRKKLKTYFVVRGDGIQLGPLSMSQIEKQVYEGKLEPDCLFREEDEDDWRELSRYVYVQPKWTLTKSLCSCYKRTFTYSGRASQGEYGWFAGIAMACGIITMAITACLIASRSPGNIILADRIQLFFPPVWVIVFALPGLAVTVRRFHDMGKSGLLLLIGFVPIVNVFWLLIASIWLFFGASDGPNQYGDRSDNAA